MNNEILKNGVLNLTPPQIKNIVWRVLSFLVSSAFMSFMPILLFLAYMLENKFFSYDFFEKGVFGMQAFFWLLALCLLAASIILYMPAFPIAKWKLEKKKPDTFSLFGSIAIASFFWLTILFLTIHKGNVNWKMLLYIAMSGLFIVIQINAMLYAKPAAQFMSLALIIISTLYLTFNLRDAAAEMVGRALKAYGSGGHICVTVTDTQSTYNLKGSLILSAPDYIYIKRNEATSVTAIRVDSNTIYNVENYECE